MRILILSLVLAVSLMIGGTAVASECDNTLYDCPIYGDLYTEDYDLPLYSATYAPQPDTDWIPGRLVGPYLNGLEMNEEWVPASLVLQR